MKQSDAEKERLEIINNKKRKEHENSVIIKKIIDTIMCTTEDGQSKIVMDFLNKKRKYETKISKKKRYLKEKEKLDEIYYSEYSPKDFLENEEEKVFYKHFCQEDASELGTIYYNDYFQYDKELIRVYGCLGKLVYVTKYIPRYQQLTENELKTLFENYQAQYNSTNRFLMNKILEYYKDDCIFWRDEARKVKLLENEKNKNPEFGELE